MTGGALTHSLYICSLSHSYTNLTSSPRDWLSGLGIVLDGTPLSVVSGCLVGVVSHLLIGVVS